MGFFHEINHPAIRGYYHVREKNKKPGKEGFEDISNWIKNTCKREVETQLVTQNQLVFKKCWAVLFFGCEGLVKRFRFRLTLLRLDWRPETSEIFAIGPMYNLSLGFIHDMSYSQRQSSRKSGGFLAAFQCLIDNLHGNCL